MAKTKAADPVLVDAPAQGQHPSVPLYIIFTRLKETRRALEAARCLARGLNIRLVLLVPQVVPYPLLLDEPPVSGEFAESVLSQLVTAQDQATAIRYLCRDVSTTIRRALTMGSLVAIGTGWRWWLGWEHRLARQLRRDGHQVILVNRRQPLRHGSARPI